MKLTGRTAAFAFSELCVEERPGAAPARPAFGIEPAADRAAVDAYHASARSLYRPGQPPGARRIVMR